MDLSHPFVVALQEHCTRATCPEMKAGEWLYLCAAHASANEVSGYRGVGGYPNQASDGAKHL